MGKMEYNAELKKIYDEIKSINSGSFSSFASESQAAFSSLTSSLSNALDSLNIGDTWDDDVKLEINGTTYTGIQSIVNSCEAAVNNSVVPAGAKVDALISTLKSYIDSVDSYNSALEQRDKIDVGTEPSRSSYMDDASYNRAHSSWSTRKNNYDAYTQMMDNQERNAKKYETSAQAKIAEIKGLFGDAAAAETAANMAGSGLTPKTTTRKNDDGSTTTTTEWYDEDGKLVEKTYQTVAQDGTVLSVGRTEYGENGAKTSNYTTKTDDYTQDVVYVYNSEGKIINSQYDTMYENGDFSSSSSEYWETTGNMKTHDYLYDSANGWSFQAHSEYSEQGVQTAGSSQMKYGNNVNVTNSSYDDQGRRVQYVSNDYDATNDNALKSSTLVTNRFDGDTDVEVGYTYDTRYPDGRQSTSEWVVSYPEEGGDPVRTITDRVDYNADGSGSKTTYQYNDSGQRTSRTEQRFDTTGALTGTVVYEDQFTETGEPNGYISKHYDTSGKLTAEYDHTGKD